MGTVYIVQEPVKRDRATGELVSTFDLTPASRFGTLEFLLPPGPVMLSPHPMIIRLRQKLYKFSDNDFLVPVGDPSAIAAAAAIAAEFNVGQINLLKWDNRQGTYIEIKMNIFGREYTALPAKAGELAL